MAYIDTNSQEVPKCALGIQRKEGMGDLTSGFSSLANSLGMSPTTLLLVGVGAIILGWMAHSFVNSAGKAIRRKKLAFRKRAQQAQGAVSDVSWGTLLTGVIAGGALYYIATRNSAGKSQQ